MILYKIANSYPKKFNNIIVIHFFLLRPLFKKIVHINYIDVYKTIYSLQQF